MRWFWAILIMWPSIAAAQMTEQETSRFLDCVEQIYSDQVGAFGAELVAPIICGERHVDIRPSCNFFEEIQTPQICLNRDAVNWLLNVREASGQGADWVPEDGSLVWQGLNRCAEITEQIEETSCIVEVYWRETMYLLAAPVIQRVYEEAGL